MSINPQQRLATIESDIQFWTEAMASLEITYDTVLGNGSAIDENGEEISIHDIAVQINRVRAMIGELRNEASFWRQELSSAQTANKETNKMSEA